MPARPLGDTHGRMTLGEACHYRLCDTQTNDVGCDIPLFTLSSTHGGMTLGVACHQRPRVEPTILKCPAWHANISLGHHIQSDEVGRGMPSSPLGKTHGQTTSGVACNHIPCTSHTVEKRRVFHAIVALDFTHGRTM